MLTPLRPEPGDTCRNCGTTLLGPWCHECGQSLRSPIRELGSLIVDGIQQVLNLDNKLFRSLLPLYFRPGWLTERYLDGQRSNFVRPLRMYLGLSVVLFFAVALSMPEPEVDSEPAPVQASAGDTVAAETASPPATATSPATNRPSDPPGSTSDQPDTTSETTATTATTPTTPTKPTTPTTPTTPSEKAAPTLAMVAAELPEERRIRIAKRVREATINLDGQAWDPVTHPLRIEFLPDTTNNWLNRRIEAGRERVIDYMVDPARFVDTFIATLPTTMFVLLPLFALLLKLMYPFSSRLYVEHLIVALHSHSFLFSGFIGMLVLSAVGTWIPALSNFCTTMIIGGAVWMPLYLLLMQKRVYRQGWLMTLFKYSVIGTLYLFMITFGLIGALLSSVLV
jgi:hypothetical protein